MKHLFSVGLLFSLVGANISTGFFSKKSPIVLKKNNKLIKAQVEVNEKNTKLTKLIKELTDKNAALENNVTKQTNTIQKLEESGKLIKAKIDVLENDYLLLSPLGLCTHITAILVTYFAAKK
jgi:predicted transcriptional regulator